MNLTLQTLDTTLSRDVAINRLIVAGWTGRNQAAMEHHIEELAAIGVPRPSQTPVFYRVSATRLTTDPEISVLGDTSSGEVEFVLFHAGDEIWVGLGSDHTDREAETHGIALSKQLCEKPLATTFWLLRDVTDHWDQLILKADMTEHGIETPYQEGGVTGLKTPSDLLDAFSNQGHTFSQGDMMFCGTLPAIGGIRPASSYSLTLTDPVLGRTLRHHYLVNILPVIS